MVYILKSGHISDEMLLEIMASEDQNAVIPVETIMRKLPLFLPFLCKNEELAKAIFPRLRTHILRSSVTLDDLGNFLTLVEALKYAVGEEDVALCSLNMLVSVTNSSVQGATKASI